MQQVQVPTQPDPAASVAASAASKGPVVKKVVDCLLLAAKAELLFRQSLGASTQTAYVRNGGVPTQSKLTRTTGLIKVSHGALLHLWYPQLRRLVLVYSGVQAELETGDEKWVSPFYLPAGYKALVLKPYAETVAALHADGGVTHQDALKHLSDGVPPESIVLCGFASGAGLANVAAPWIALAYPSADVRLITFGGKRVASPPFRRLLEWAVGVRIRVLNLQDTEATVGPGSDKDDSGTFASIVKVDAGPNIAPGTLAAYIVGVANYADAAPHTNISGVAQQTGAFDPGSWWAATDHVAKVGRWRDQILAVAGERSAGNAAAVAAVLDREVEELSLIGTVSPVRALAEVTDVIPGFVAPPFKLLHDIEKHAGDLETLLKRLAVAATTQAAGYAGAAYAANVIPDEFIDMGKLPQPNTHVSLISDPITGSDVYVAWYEASGTALLVFRGTESSSWNDIRTDCSIIRTKSVDDLTGPQDGVAVHHGFVGQFRAVANDPSKDKKLPWEYQVRASFNKNSSKSTLGRDIGCVLSKQSRDRQPLRVICCGHSLGGALATLGAMWAAWSYPDADVRCITFGSPLVGNSKFAAAFREVVSTRVRVVHRRDPVPSVPFNWWGFEHVSPCLFLKDKTTGEVELKEKAWWRGLFVLSALFKRGDHSMRDSYIAALAAAAARLAPPAAAASTPAAASAAVLDGTASQSLESLRAVQHAALASE